MGLFSRSVPPQAEVIEVKPPAIAHHEEILRNFQRATEAEKRATALLRIAQVNEQQATDALVDAQDARKVASSRLRAVAEGRV